MDLENGDGQYEHILQQIRANPRMAKEFILQQTRAMMPDADTNPEMQQMQLLRDDEVMPFLLQMMNAMPLEDACKRMKEELHLPDVQVQMIGKYLGKFKTDMERMHGQ